MSNPWTFPWERDAQKGLSMPKDLSLPDQMAYAALRNIYESHRGKRISREQAVREKQLLRREWERAKDEEAFNIQLANFHSKLLRNTEIVKTEVRRNPSRENALRLCNVIDGLVKEIGAERRINDGTKC